MRMNSHIVQLVAQAIAQWLPPNSTVVIGRDARYRSEDFAKVTARVLVEAGHTPRVFTDPVPTPVVAHEVAHTAAAGGVMITASHNPASDNGVKVYTADGGQLLPDDAFLIEETMSKLAWPTEVSTELPGGIELLGEPEVAAYLNTIAETVSKSGGLTIAYTAMHGVGGDLFVRALEGAGHRVVSVPDQHDPDPDFPTAPFPNPEEPGTLDHAIALADQESADLVMANDPDADRLAVAVRRKQGWERLTGDQIGTLLGRHLLAKNAASYSVATTIVSSSLLAKMAAEAGVTCHTTLTGFKWLARAADGTDAPLVFAYEEALGYSVVPSIRDKDGISAALLFAEMVASLPNGHGPDDVLADVYSTHGVHLNSQRSVRFEGDDAMAQMTTVMGRLRESPPKLLKAQATADLLTGNGPHEPADVLIYEVENGRVIFRPSGTEPKLKAYLEAVHPDQRTAAIRLAELDAAVATILG